MIGDEAIGRLAIGRLSTQAAAQLALVATVGVFTLSGQAVLQKFTKITAAGTYALTGVVAGLLAGKSLMAAAGAYTLTGVAAIISATITSVATSTGLGRHFRADPKLSQRRTNPPRLEV